MKITLGPNLDGPRFAVGLSHAGVRLKREYGGPPWYRGINGLRFRTPRAHVFVEFWKPSTRRTGLVVDYRHHAR